MNRMTKAVTTVAAAVTVAATGASLTQSAGAATQPNRNGVDASFLRSNEQVNLAEITVGAIVFLRANGPAAIALARMTSDDHVVARTLNMALSKKIGVTLPTQPNAQQQAVAKHLQTTARPNQQYFVAQIAGHKQSIAATKYEIKNGIRPRVVAYAKAYLKLATMHLVMAEKDLAAWNRRNG